MLKCIYLGPENLTGPIADMLGSAFRVSHAATTEEVEALMPETDLILDAYMKVHLDASLLCRAPNLKLVITITTGSDHICAKHLEERDIPLMTLRDVPELLASITPAAELAWLLLMACARKFSSALKHVESGGWNRNLFPGIMLNGKTLGVIGCGRLGTWVSRYACAFGMEVIGYDPHLDTFPGTIRAVSLNELTRHADFISIHVPLHEDTRGLLGRECFDNMKPGVVIVNTSRGAVIDEDALLEGLLSGRVGSAGLDVLQGEPMIAENPLFNYSLTHSNLIITPHIGGFSPDALAFLARKTCGRIIDFFSSKHLHPVR